MIYMYTNSDNMYFLSNFFIHSNRPYVHGIDYAFVSLHSLNEDTKHVYVYDELDVDSVINFLDKNNKSIKLTIECFSSGETFIYDEEIYNVIGKCILRT